ncbi:lipoprotein [Paraburkholderia sp. D15]|uniref:LPS translocon maturation chaperone LptM n=1 Tax=Paraburkholderia sp. D15 TaxID=2880218 RepID=UPI002478C912|nr:lipoprotein [Paraburkholderia sp. D15]WGS49606.1 lipoprotein [Paraburkholderia sp. D15]
MRVVPRMRAAVSGRAIVAGLAILAGCALAGCGQRGSLYLPTVPPLPAKPTDSTQALPPAATNAASNTATPGPVGEVPDTSGSPLSLAPETELAAPPATATAASASAAPLPASAATPVQ